VAKVNRDHFLSPQGIEVRVVYRLHGLGGDAAGFLDHFIRQFAANEKI